MPSSLVDKRILITGAARGIGAALAERLHARGGRVALVGLEPERLAAVAARCGNAPWRRCDVTDRQEVESALAAMVSALGGLDIVVANAGVGAQVPIVGGDPEVMRRIIDVNVMGVYHTLRTAGPHISHKNGYAVVISSLAAALNVPLLGAYSASKAAVEVLGNTLRTELQSTGARVGVAYFAELDTDMTRRGFATRAAKILTGGKTLTKISPLGLGIDALERGIARRSRIIVAPSWVAPLLRWRMYLQPLVDRWSQRNLEHALEVARSEQVELTTQQEKKAAA